MSLASEDQTYDMRVTSLGQGQFGIKTGPRSMRITLRAVDAQTYHVTHEGRRQTISVVHQDTSVSLFLDGRTYRFDLPDPLAAADGDQAGGDAVIAPMPGFVKVVSTHAGASVRAGDPLIVLEAMKMEHTLTAPRDGTVAEVLTAEGDQVTDGTLLLTLDGEDG